MNPIVLLFTFFPLINTLLPAEDSTNSGYILKKNNSIVLIIPKHQRVENVWRFNNNIAYKTLNEEISFFKGIKMEYVPLKKGVFADTCIVDLISEHLIVRGRFDAINYYEFLFNKGDTVIIDYKNGHPFPIVINRNTAKWDINYDYLFKTIIHRDSLSPVFKYFRSDLFVNYYNTSQKEIEKQKRNAAKSAYKDAVSLLNSEKHIVDSLYTNHLISNTIFEFQTNKILNTSVLLNLMESNISSERIKSLIKTDFTSSTEFPNLYYYTLIDQFANIYLRKRVQNMDLKDGLNRDYRQSYDSIRASTLFTKKTKEYLLFRELSRISSTFSKDDFGVYYRKFLLDVKDSAIIDLANSENLLSLFSDSSKENQMIFLNGSKLRSSLPDLLIKNRGKVLYVDFWASWCAPCREAFTQSSELLKTFKNKNISFIYLSLDRNFNDWQRASIHEGLNTNSENYLVLDPDKSNFLKVHKVYSIPRYMIFNKSGILSHDNALPINSKDLTVLLEKIIEEK